MKPYNDFLMIAEKFIDKYHKRYINQEITYAQYTIYLSIILCDAYHIGADEWIASFHAASKDRVFP